MFKCLFRNGLIAGFLSFLFFSSSPVFSKPINITHPTKPLFQKPSPSDKFFAITYGNNEFVVVGASGVLFTSTDGVKWRIVKQAKTGNTLNGISYGAHKFVSVGNWGTMLISDNGINWRTINLKIKRTKGHIYIRNNIAGITYGNNEFIAVGWGGDNFRFKRWYTLDQRKIKNIRFTYKCDLW